MNVKETNSSSLIHDMSVSSKGKLIWTGSYEALQCFVKEVLNMADGSWTCPGGESKQYKSKNIDIRWYPESKSITLNGELKDQIKEQLVALASIAKELANGNDEIQCEEAILNVMEKTPANSFSIQDDQMLSLEALQSQIQILIKEVNVNTAALENMKKKSNPLLIQESKNEVDGLKEKIYKLMDENKHLKSENNDLTERINNLSYILADLQQKTKNAEQERDSLIIAMRLLIAETNSVVENNVPEQKLCNEADECSQSNSIVENNVIEQKLGNESDECTQSQDIINPNIKLKNRFLVLEKEQANAGKLSTTSNQEIEQVIDQKKKKRKSKSKKKTTNNAASRKPQEGEQENAEQQEQQPRKQVRKTVVVAGDSIIKHVKGWELSNNKQNVAVKSFSGATVEDMNDFLRPTIRRQPDNLVIHVGTNDIRSSTPQNISDEVTKVAQLFKQESRKTEIIISSLIIRSDSPELANKVKDTNVALKLKCAENNWSFIDNSNINCLHLNRRGLHLNHEGTALLQANIGNILKSQD